MEIDSRLLGVSPVLPSQDIDRDVTWYHQHTGFELIFSNKMYAVLRRGQVHIHLQWHADNASDPLLGGSVIRLFVKPIHPFFEEFVKRGTVTPDKLRLNTPWHTHEFGFWDLNKNAIFLVEDL